MGFKLNTDTIFLFRQDEGAGGSALGTGGDPGTEGSSSAGTENTDTATGSASETVPYSRFKEVNDRLSGYRDLENLGYDSDSLGRLVQFEAALVENPSESLNRLVDNLDLPDHVKDGVKAQLAAQDSGDGAGRREPGTGEEKAEDPPAWAAPLLQRDRDQRDREEKEQTEAVERRQEETLDAVMDHWRTKDKEDGIETSDSTMLAYIAANASNGSTVEQVAEAARKDRLEAREVDLRGVVREVGNGQGLPRPVPSGGPPAGEGIELKDIKSATAAARAAIEAGTLPGLGG